MPRLAVATPDGIDARRLGGALASGPRARTGASDAALVIAPVRGDALVLGAFQRARSTFDLARVASRGDAIARRSSGGGAVRAREGQVFVALDLARADSLDGVADPNRALNRHVRPVLRALSKLGNVAATYGGRDFVTMNGVPVAWLGVAHDGRSGAIGVELLVAVETPFAIDEPLDLAHGAIAPRWLGKTPGTLGAVLRRDVATAEVVGALVDTWTDGVGGDVAGFDAGGLRALDPDTEAPPFDALVEEAIGLIGACLEPGRVALGGELMASTDALEALGRRLDALGPAATDDALGGAIDAALGPASGALLVGVRALPSIAKVVRAAWTAHPR